MFPDGDRAVANCFDQFRPALVDFLRSYLLREIKVGLDLIGLSLYSDKNVIIIILSIFVVCSKVCYSKNSMNKRPDTMSKIEQEKPLFWIGRSRDDLKDFPADVQDVMGYALNWAQQGGKSADAKPLQGFGGAGVLEVVDDFDGNTYRTVYTVRFLHAVYVLHAFQKKSHKGIATPKHDIELIRTRLKRAESDYQEWLLSNKQGGVS